MKFFHLLTETFKGRSLGRAIQNFEFSMIHLKGDGVDLGASTNKGSYYEFLQLDPACKIEFTDLIPRSEGVTKLDLEEELPFASDSKDFIILNNVLYAIFNYSLCVNECRRILKPGGEILGVIPFFHILVPDPQDNFRFTQTSLTRIFNAAGFQEVRISSLGYGVFSSCANAWATMLKFNTLKFMVYVVAIGLDKLIAGLSKLISNSKSNRGEIWSVKYFPIYYMFHCKK